MTDARRAGEIGRAAEEVWHRRYHTPTFDLSEPGPGFKVPWTDGFEAGALWERGRWWEAVKGLINALRDGTGSYEGVEGWRLGDGPDESIWADCDYRMYEALSALEALVKEPQP